MRRPERRNPPGLAGSEGAFAGRGMRRNVIPTRSGFQWTVEQTRRGVHLYFVRLAILYAPPLTPSEAEAFDWLRAREMKRAEARRAGVQGTAVPDRGGRR